MENPQHYIIENDLQLSANIHSIQSETQIDTKSCNQLDMKIQKIHSTGSTYSQNRKDAFGNTILRHSKSHKVSFADEGHLIDVNKIEAIKKSEEIEVDIFAANRADNNLKCYNCTVY